MISIRSFRYIFIQVGAGSQKMVFGGMGKRVRSRLMDGGFSELQAEILYQATFVKSSKRMTFVPTLLLAEWNARDFLVRESSELIFFEPWSKEAFLKRFYIWETMFGKDSFGSPENPGGRADYGYINIDMSSEEASRVAAYLGKPDPAFTGRGGYLVGKFSFPGQPVRTGALMLIDGRVGVMSESDASGNEMLRTFSLREISSCSVSALGDLPISLGENIGFNVNEDPVHSDRILLNIVAGSMNMSFASWFKGGESEISNLHEIAEYIIGMIDEGIALNKSSNTR